MKRLSTLDIKTEGSLRVKRRTVILTGQQSNPDSNEEELRREMASSHHITSREYEDSDSEMELAETPKTHEDGGQATVDDLKELNLGTTEEPCPIYVRPLLTPEEEISTSIFSRSIRTCSHGVIKKCQGLIPKLLFIACPSKGECLQRSSPNDVSIQS